MKGDVPVQSIRLQLAPGESIAGQRTFRDMSKMARLVVTFAVVEVVTISNEKRLW
jgi:hypothetical protein